MCGNIQYILKSRQSKLILFKKIKIEIEIKVTYIYKIFEKKFFSHTVLPMPYARTLQEQEVMWGMNQSIWRKNNSNLSIRQ